jgi:hypothetical protein
MRLLDRARFNDDVLKTPIVAAVGEAILGGPSLAQESHGLIEARGRFCYGN